jgi:hypothetical protein
LLRVIEDVELPAPDAAVDLVPVANPDEHDGMPKFAQTLRLGLQRRGAHTCIPH